MVAGSFVVDSTIRELARISFAANRSHYPRIPRRSFFQDAEGGGSIDFDLIANHIAAAFFN